MTVERPHAERRGGGQLHAGGDHGDDDGEHHGGDADADGDGGEQGLRRDAGAPTASCTLTGVVGSDVVTLHGGTATFDTASVGTGKTVTVSGLTLSGAAAGNYTLSTTTATTTADITAATLTPTVTAANKAYDGTTRRRRRACTLTGVVGDRCRDAARAARRRSTTASVGTGKTVTVSGLTLSGAAASNYTLSTHDGDDDGGHHGARR